MNSSNEGSQTAGRISVRRTMSIVALGLVVGSILFAKWKTTEVSPPAVLPTETNARSVVVGVLDTSASNRGSLPADTEELAKVPLIIGPGTWLSALRCDDKVQELYSGPMPESDEALINELGPKLGPVSNRDNTYLNPLFDQLVDRLKKLKGRCVIIIWTDGYAEGTTRQGHEDVLRDAKLLAENSHVAAIFIVGVAPANMTQMCADLAPCAAKLRFLSTGSLDVSLVAGLLRSGGGN